MSSPAHTRYVQSLYRRALRLSQDWYYVRREFAREKAVEIRARFEKNRNITNPKAIERLTQSAERELEEFAHPDPYKYPTAPDGSKWERNLPPRMVCLVL
ncbi:uncharacterized protein VTP21DRAFT_1874 [Calcarisporiella thermophila]|uniref:uncharacterized protein n=1 Tax=Calcarisporiella thermophila TaxID=911321 RepID=UPI00374239BC